MDYKLLGRSGLRVSELALGTMTFGEDWGWGADRRESRLMFDSYAAAGGNFIDTANNYTNGTSERLVGEFIARDRHRFVVASKYTLTTRPGDPNFSGNHRKNMMRSVEESLTRLGTDYLDLLWLHAWDNTTPLDEILRAMDDLVSAGKVHYLGISDTPAWVVARANTLAELRGWARFIGLQLKYSLLERTVERELLPMAEAMGLGVTAWGALGSGVLTGKYNGAKPARGRAAELNMIRDQDLETAREVINIAEDIGCSPSQVALAWLRHRPDSIIPILGAKNQAQLLHNLDCLKVSLCSEQLARLQRASVVELGFPHDFLEREAVRAMIYGTAFDRPEHPYSQSLHGREHER